MALRSTLDVQLSMYKPFRPATSAARKFWAKLAKFLKTPKDLHQSSFEISKDLHQRPLKSQKYLHQSSKNQFEPVFLTKFWKEAQKVAKFQSSKCQKKLPKAHKSRQRLIKVANFATSSWQHCLPHYFLYRICSSSNKHKNVVSGRVF